MTEAEAFAAVLRDEAVRRVDNRYVHHALIRNDMRAMADRIERWERLEFNPTGGFGPCDHEARIRDLLRQASEIASDLGQQLLALLQPPPADGQPSPAVTRGDVAALAEEGGEGA